MDAKPTALAGGAPDQTVTGRLAHLAFCNTKERIDKRISNGLKFYADTTQNIHRRGLALFGPGHILMGAIGVSGDTSCADHMIAWRTRNVLGLDHLGTTIPGPASGFGHPKCLNTGDPSKLPAVSQ